MNYDTQELEKIPLTSSQMEIYLDQAKSPNSSEYTIGGYIHIRNAVDTEIFVAAMERVTAHSDAFHLAFEENDEEITQTYRKTPSKFQCHDFSHLADPEASAFEWIHEQLQQTFDLSEHGLYSFHIIKIAEQHSIWVGFAHHLIFDGLSYGLLAKNIFSTYNALCMGLLEGEVTYSRDFIDLTAVSSEYLTSRAYKKSKEYWETQLSTPIEPIIEPKYRVTDEQTPTFLVKENIDLAEYDALSEMAKQLGCGVHQLFLAALYSYFYNTSGIDNFPICLPFHNRSGKAKNIIGCFASMSPLFLTCSKEMTFAQLVTQIGEQTRGLIKHTKFPLSHAIQQVRDRQPHIQRLTDINFNYYKAEFDIPDNELDLEIHSLRTGQQPPLKFHLCEFSGQQNVQIQIEARRAFFKTEEAAAILSRVRLILNQVRHNPQLALEDMILSTQQDEQAYQALNAANLTVDTQTDFISLFEQRVTTTPDDIAIVFGDHRLSYQALNAKANQLANRLLKAGVQPGDNVGICVSRSIGLVIGQLATLKACATFVPMDPKVPAQRLQDIAIGSEQKVIITESDLLVKLPPSITSTLVDGAQSDSWLDRYDTADLKLTTRPEQAAYIIHTSGSTGKPKGVVVTQANLTHFMHAMVHILAEKGLQGAYKWAWNAPAYFDASIQALSQLAFGVELHLLSDAQRSEPTQLVQYLNDNQIALLDITPSLVELLLSEAQTQGIKLPSLLVGGEAIGRSLWRKLAEQNQLDGTFTLNMYGPTEGTVNSTYADLKDASQPTIGRCLPNVKATVVNNLNSRLPIGVAGELVLSGAQIASGYFNNTVATDEQYFYDDAQGWSYKTGDLVSLNSDGSLHYLKRKDDQIKLRGYRIELEEIEEVLCTHQAVQDAAVIVKSEQLVAFIVSESVSSNEINSFLSEQLPEYMRPQHLEFVEQIARNANGKKDRKSLQKFEINKTQTRREGPATETEEAVQAIWQSLVGKEDIGLDDNFFDIGGHSLLAIRLTSACRERFSTELQLAEFMENPTISAIATKIDTTLAEKRVIEQICTQSPTPQDNVRIKV
ncbi:non-ribosomal peptide synthetase [Pseudoalteromonas rubra]|uniref:non-ribosomal peptide synthetase n=1 Tax=Pseudoalteromonas rubra TaxID=43658 RepID=UPI000F76E45E|nr:non-ribosomal peptide synthetase [Pseudoalteromonas rubra]